MFSSIISIFSIAARECQLNGCTIELKVDAACALACHGRQWYSKIRQASLMDPSVELGGAVA